MFMSLDVEVLIANVHVRQPLDVEVLIANVHVKQPLYVEVLINNNEYSCQATPRRISRLTIKLETSEF
jgi:hypothetical protein